MMDEVYALIADDQLMVKARGAGARGTVEIFAGERERDGDAAAGCCDASALPSTRCNEIGFPE